MTDQHEARAREVMLEHFGRKRLTTFGEQHAIAAMLAYADERTAVLTAEVNKFREWLEFVAHAARYNLDAGDAKVAEVLGNVLSRYDEARDSAPAALNGETA